MKLGLFHRLLISIGLILSIAIVVTGYLLIDYAEKYFEISRQGEAQTLVHNLAELSVDALITQDFELLERFVKSVTKYSKYTYAYLASGQGQVLTHSDVSNVSTFLKPVGELRTSLIHEVFEDGKKITEVVYPIRINDQFLANAHIGYIYDSTVFFKEQAKTIIMVLVSFFCLAVIIIYIISRHVVNPLTQLTKLISEASFDAPQVIVPHLLNRGDEVGLLANAFDAMQTKIISSYNEIQQESTKLTNAILEREVAFDKLKLSAAVVENTAEAIIVTNEKKQIISTNKAFSEITGYSQEEVIGVDPKILNSKKHNKTFYRDMWDTIVHVGQWQGELWDRKKSGEIFPTWSTITAIFDDKSNVINYVSVFSDISTLKQSQEELNFLAHHDPLTSLPNRILLNDRIEHALRRSDRDSKKVGILFLDLDRFKNVNDSLGHPVGDTLLIESAQRIGNIVRKEDTVARLGGDEFVIVVEDISDVHALVLLVQKIKLAFEQPFVIAGHKLFITVSVGISVYPNNGKDSATLLKNADIAMYRAKDDGRDGYRFYTEGLSSRVFQRLTLENALRQSVARNELVLYYQPQFNLANNQLVGVEALLRWQHAERGLLLPDAFIELSEESALIIPIGEWVIHTAFSQMQKWQSDGYNIERMAINVSGMQFQRGNIAQTISQELLQTGVNPGSIELEITESCLLHKIDWVIGVLDLLKSLGLSLAIDDFGTGYSSLSYLKRLPIDKLKIDRSFVSDIPHDSNDEAITRAIIALGKSLNLRIIAEGIETKELSDFLKSLGCHEGQGFYYGHPMSSEAIERLFLIDIRSAVKPNSPLI